MNIEELKSRFYSESQAFVDRVQESSAYNTFSDIYYNWPTGLQRGFKIGSLALILLIVAMVPYGSLSTSSEAIENFDGTRDMIREMIKVSRDLASAPQLPSPPNAEYLKSQIEASLKRADLSAEQIKGINPTLISVSGIMKDWIDTAFEVQLENLNLQQILDVGADIQSLQTNVKIADMTIEAGKVPLYHNVVFKVFTLAGKSSQEVEAEEPEPSKTSRSGRGSR